MEKNNVTLNKIPVVNLINALIHLHSLGVNYVNIEGINNEVQDSMNLTFSKDYLSPDSPFIEEDSSTLEVPFSDEDFNNIM
jgi:Ca2+-dependent lipid-binding protein